MKSMVAQKWVDIFPGAKFPFAILLSFGEHILSHLLLAHAAVDY